ncbi:MAG: HNH endonuclease signature motif containing protein [Acidobacteriota bacterium]
MDGKRLFTPEQRRILWKTAESRSCRPCRRARGLDDFTADHIKPYSKGGRTELLNAAIFFQSCNAAKGNRSRRLRRSRRRVA